MVDRPWPTVGRPVVLVPLGSTEQHGPHLPLDTDVVVASVVCDALVLRAQATRPNGTERDADAGGGVDLVVAPAIAYGASGEHQEFTGTISIGTEALTLLLVEYGRSACTWAQRVVFVNGHGGNVDALATAVPLLIGEGRPVAWLPCVPATRPSAAAEATSVPDALFVDAHAGRSETAIMLAHSADRVHANRLEPGNTAPISQLLAELRDGGTRRVAPNGVLGDPRGATAVEGAALLDAIVTGAWSRLRSGRVDERGCLIEPADA
ncbi:MAG: mycofactocin biosynthesis peptidyl-dipeptidase MftE [Actinomycetota bacterium]|nr:mycofactocin biosynthesis peptidyl-dipeptidase MftE [Actinomycetota bacterium]